MASLSRSLERDYIDLRAEALKVSRGLRDHLDLRAVALGRAVALERAVALKAVVIA